MSLSKAIIYESLATVKALVNAGEPLNEVDEYSFTPLVETAIVNDAAKMECLLKAGADPNFTDLSGRSALHWCADNNNVELCILLLSYKASPNAITRAGQPVLTMPLLRQHKKLVDLLQSHGADTDFAQDFIHAKLLSHRFELKGRVDIVDHQNTLIEINYEGFYLEFTLSIALNSLQQFKNNYQMRHFRHYTEALDTVIKSFENANGLIKLQHYLTKPEKHQDEINALLSQKLLIIPIACQGHAIIMVHYGDYIFRCDRGAYGREHGTVILYKMKYPEKLTKKLMTRLIYKHTTREDINEGLPKLLGFEKITTLPISEQISGNCSWANVEAAIAALLFLTGQGERERFALKFFHEWERWDQNRALHFCIERFETTNSPARRASMASMLAAVLFQRCDHRNTEDMSRAKKIVTLLAPSEFRYILESYYAVYTEGKKNAEGNNFTQILDDFGVRLD